MFRNFIILTISLLSFWQTAFAQLTVTGRVINEENDAAVIGASVYFNNTSIGTSTANDGSFTLRLSSNINTELIISAIGFEMMILKLDKDIVAGKKFLFKLRRKEEELREVLLIPDAKRRQWLEIFKTNFLGQTEAASRCNIANLKDIYFTRGDGPKSFKAFCDTPLIITNKLLGYKLHFQLIEFGFDEESNRTYFYGYTRYEDLDTKDKYLKRRRGAYYGSTLHFYRSLLQDKLEEESFDVYSVIEFKTSADAKPMNVASKTTAKNIIQRDSADTNFYRISFPGKLMVQYKKDPASKKYLSQHIFLSGSIKYGTQSFIILKEDRHSFMIDKNGILADPLSIEYTGYWIYEKVADLLPFDYQPEALFIK